MSCLIDANVWVVANHVMAIIVIHIVNKELAEYNNSPIWDCPTFFNDNEDHSVQYKEYLENPSNEIVASDSNQEKEKPPQDSNIRQLIREECCIKVCRKQKQNMKDTMLELIENFKVIHKSSTFLNNTSQISPVHAIAPILPTEEPEYSLSMGEYEVTYDDESECDVPVKDESSLVFTTFSNPLFDDNDDFISSDDESLSEKDVLIKEFKVYSNPLFDNEEINSDELVPHCFNAESDFVKSLSNRDTLIDSSLKFDFLEEIFGAFLPTSIADEERIRREHAEYISLMERLFTINPCPRPMENYNTIVETLPTSPILIEDNDSQREEIDIFIGTDELLPPSIESDDYDSEGEIHFLEELLVDDSISLSENESFYFNDQDDLQFPRPPPEPPDVEFDFEPNTGEVISAVMNNIDELKEDKYFDPGGEIDIFTNVKDDDYFPFMFVIRMFLPYLIFPEDSPLLLSAESEDTIFDPGISV
nr:hypothetical protein [Tanacetum cinerariifolium]